MTTKIDVKEVCRAYNEARDENKGKKGGSSWVYEILKKKGLSISMIKRIIREPTLLTPFHRENAGKGNYKGYIFPYDPINIIWFQNWISGNISSSKKEEPKKDISFEEECAEYLRKQGYKLKKLVGFDEDAFKRAYPQLWEKFLIYEEV